MEIVFEGIKATVESITPKQADNVWTLGDYFVITLSLSASFNGLLAFSVELPLSTYENMRFPAVQLKEWVEKEARNSLRGYINQENAARLKASQLERLNGEASKIAELLNTKVIGRQP